MSLDDGANDGDSIRMGCVRGFGEGLTRITSDAMEEIAGNAVEIVLSLFICTYRVITNKPKKS